MRRPVLLTVALLGGVISVASAAVFTASSDRATGGPNDVSTGVVAVAADLKVARAGEDETGTLVCGEYLDDLTTAEIDATGASPGFGERTTFCLRNDGTRALSLAASATDLTDVEEACTNDEAAVDSTCGTGAGEASDVLLVAFDFGPCGGQTGMTEFTPLRKAAQARQTLLTVAPGGVVCVTTRTVFPTDEVFYEEDETVRADAAQSDRAVWRWAFDGLVDVA